MELWYLHNGVIDMWQDRRGKCKYGDKAKKTTERKEEKERKYMQSNTKVSSLTFLIVAVNNCQQGNSKQTYG